MICLSSIFMLGAAPTPFVGGFYMIGKNTITVAWDAVPGATSYRVRVVYLDRNTIFPYTTVTTNTATINKPRSGHFRVDVQALNPAGASAWSRSTDSTNALVGTNAMGWQIFWGVELPTGVVIE